MVRGPKGVSDHKIENRIESLGPVDPSLSPCPFFDIYLVKTRYPSTYTIYFLPFHRHMYSSIYRYFLTFLIHSLSFVPAYLPFHYLLYYRRFVHVRLIVGCDLLGTKFQ